MIRTMLKPFLKKFIGLFISMVFVSSLAIGLFCSFSSTISNLQKTFGTYIDDYGKINAVANINFSEKSQFADITSVDGVKAVEYRLTMDAFLKKSNGRTITARLFTFKEDDTILKRYILESCEPSADKINVSVVRKFAENNGFKPGDSLQIGYFGLFLNFYINEIVETPEAIQARANNYVWSDNTDFGYLYVEEKELNKALFQLASLLEEKINAVPEFAEYYDELVNAVGVTFPDIANMAVKDGFTDKFTNQILITGDDGVTEEEVVYNIKAYLTGKDVRYKSVTENHKEFYYVYMEHAIEQMRVAAIFIPVFFYSVTMIVIGLFVNQIIKAMTPQIGIMMSVGVGKKDIISIFIVFSFLMCVFAGVFGVGLGVVINGMLATTMINVYSIPTIPYVVNPWLAALSVILLLVFAQATTMISCLRIFKITPKDATISNEAKRKRLPRKVESFIDGAPMSIKLGVNTIAQNPRRFFVSVFSIFAALVIIILALFFNVSKNELINQTVNSRISYDAQVYMTSVADDETIDKVRSQPNVTGFIDAYYTYAEISDVSGIKRTYIECLAYDESVENNMIIIPSKTGRGRIDIEEKGLILPTTIADELGVKTGDYVSVNGMRVEVADVSYQYFHPLTYLSKTQMESLNLQYVSTFLVNVNDSNAFLEFMSQEGASLTVFTASLTKDVRGVFDSINVFIYILIGFSLGMAFLILAIMSQNALMEQKRQVSVFRAIGFTIKDISNLWTLQSVLQLVLSAIVAIPTGTLVSYILFKMCSSAIQVYPLIFSGAVILFALAFILVILIACHIIAMLTVKKWVLADNLRSRE